MKREKESKKIKGKRESKIIFSKNVRDVLVTTFLSIILIIALYLISLFPDSESRYTTLILFFSFFIVFIALLIRKMVVIPIIFLVVSLATMNMEIFYFEGLTLIYIFLTMGIIFVLVFYFLNLLVKDYNTSVIISIILVLALMPLIASLLISFSLTKTFLYDIFNISLENLFLSFLGALIALVVWHRFRTMQFMLKMGY